MQGFPVTNHLTRASNTVFNCGGADGSPNHPTDDVLSGSDAPVTQLVVLTAGAVFSFHIGDALAGAAAVRPSATSAEARNVSRARVIQCSGRVGNSSADTSRPPGLISTRRAATRPPLSGHRDRCGHGRQGFDSAPGRRDTGPMPTGNDELVRSSFDAFLRGDWDTLAQVMDPGAEWLGYEPGDRDCHGRKRVLATLFERQREGVVTGLNAVVAVDERVFVEIIGPRLEQWGMPDRHACMVVTVRDGRIVRMQDYPSRAAALAGAGLPPEPETDAAPEGTLAGDPPRLRSDAPLAGKVTDTIRSGDAAMLEQLLREHPELAHARVADPGCRRSRTLLHVVTDWPGHVPDAAAKIRALVAAGADVNARFTGPHSETPLHWAASSDDIEALDALLDAGADIEADGAVIGGGTPMADAVAFGQWAAARRLLERGARTNLWQAAALGLLDRVREELGLIQPTREDLDNALWCSAHGGQRTTAELLLERGADPSWVGHDELTAAAAAERSNAPELAAWLREQAANRPPPP